MMGRDSDWDPRDGPLNPEFYHSSTYSTSAHPTFASTLSKRELLGPNTGPHPPVSSSSKRKRDALYCCCKTFCSFNVVIPIQFLLLIGASVGGIVLSVFSLTGQNLNTDGTKWQDSAHTVFMSASLSSFIHCCLYLWSLSSVRRYEKRPASFKRHIPAFTAFTSYMCFCWWLLAGILVFFGINTPGHSDVTLMKWDMVVCGFGAPLMLFQALRFLRAKRPIALHKCRDTSGTRLVSIPNPTMGGADIEAAASPPSSNSSKKTNHSGGASPWGTAPPDPLSKEVNIKTVEPGWNLQQGYPPQPRFGQDTPHSHRSGSVSGKQPAAPPVSHISQSVCPALTQVEQYRGPPSTPPPATQMPDPVHHNGISLSRAASHASRSIQSTPKPRPPIPVPGIPRQPLPPLLTILPPSHGNNKSPYVSPYVSDDEGGRAPFPVSRTSTLNGKGKGSKKGR
ncbi:hypothetical protein B0T17DRAFT_66061 [Bombardia bombarda]|uniref:Uncharacterized protein n=1 Tax=Bombardia bombarda TaxID=252184 RepID=A0AA39XL36_9PEZI|nr:hypothetical protein B0T17DRAFT_66061 [Bombardia bombarda]